MLYLDCSHAHRQHGKQALMEEVTWHLEGPGLCALRRTGGTGGATEAPVSLWRGRQEMGADWTHMASMVWAQSVGLLWGAWISVRWHHTQWLIIFRTCGNMFWDLPNVNYACFDIWLQEDCEIKASLGRESIFSRWTLNTALQKGLTYRNQIYFCFKVGCL